MLASIITSTACGSSVFLLSYRNTIFNQSPCVFWILGLFSKYIYIIYLNWANIYVYTPFWRPQIITTKTQECPMNTTQYKLHILPKRACIPSCTSFGFLLLEIAARALKISGDPLPRARNVTPLGLHFSQGNFIPW